MNRSTLAIILVVALIARLGLLAAAWDKPDRLMTSDSEGYIELSDKFPKLISSVTQDAQGFEVFYNIEVTPWAHITPDFQIVDPSIKAVDTSYIAGLRARIDF